MYSSASASLAIIVVAFSCESLPAQASGPAARKSSLRGELSAVSFEHEVREATAEVLGCGGRIDEARLARVEEALLPIWRASPKNEGGRVQHRTLRYMAHRYFTRRFSMWVRGLEHSGSAISEWRAADVLSQQVPRYVESVLASRHAAEHGFDLRDAALMVAALERMVFDAESQLLEDVYRRHMRPTDRGIHRSALVAIVQEYLLRWILAENVGDGPGPIMNREATARAFPNWRGVADMADGEIRALDFRKRRLAKLYTFEDAHEIVGGIVHRFGSFWESECTSMKDQLVAMDVHKTGRVPLAKFYGTGLDADWRFAESEAYLRDLGALDETSAWRGKQVIIANYIQSLLGEVEAGVGRPVGTPDEILRLVGNMTSQHALDGDADEGAPQVSASLRRQLEEIASAHGGQVPLHGRLFAQWLHYAFPRECPFPHRAGAASARTPTEFGQGYIATPEDMREHANLADAPQEPVDKEELQWMSQWSSEEELTADYRVHLRAPWERNVGSAAVLAAAALALAALGRAGGLGGSPKVGSVLPSYQKSHLI
ncbi:unnamed protein product [Prorocentrum cordatum]|uniref:Uncharacterized protein n=1 Tax=Prorocentrum cordatum TaxID=2364126 RepID=A0ABN9WUG7_9DINO|nr:unnamed protein product [Polarella glacialis]